MTSLTTRRLGPLTVSAIGLGCMNLNHAYGIPPSADEGAALLERAFDLGVTMFDTAALYGLGKSERLVGRTLGGRRDAIVLASKGVLDFDGAERKLDGRPEAITASLDRSLARLGTDRIDLYYLHRLDKAVPIEDSVGAVARAVEAGKVRAIGLSEMSAATLRRAHAAHPIAAVQSEYSPVVRNPEIAVIEACRALGIGFVAFSPVARGLLAGAVRDDGYEKLDIRAAMPRFVGDRLLHNLAAVDAFDALAAEIGCTPAQLSLAWVLAQGDDVVPIPGTRSIAHLEANLGALEVSLTPEVMARIDSIFAPGAIVGARYSAAMQAQIDTEVFAEEELG